MERIDYADLNNKEKESYNFHKIAAVLANYGYNSVWLTDDVQVCFLFGQFRREEHSLFRVVLL